jgi:hypothetical protein
MENRSHESVANRDQVRITSLSEQGKDADYAHLTPAERIGLMWGLAVDAWAFLGEDVAESRFQRHVVRVIRGRPKDLADVAWLEASDQEPPLPPK